MAFTLKSLAGLVGLEGEPDETAVVQALTRRLDTGTQAAAKLEGLEADLTAARAQAASVPTLTAERDKLRIDLDAASKALAMVPELPAPAAPATAKYKAGDKVLYKGAELGVKEDLGVIQCYALDDESVAPEKDLEPVSAETAARAADTAKALAGVARLVRSKMPEAEQKALALQVATGKLGLAAAMEKIQAAPPVPLKALQGMKPQDTRAQAPESLRRGATLRGGTLVNG